MKKPRKYPRNITKIEAFDGRVIEFDPPVNVYVAVAEASKRAK
jgi:hypothetical protein